MTKYIIVDDEHIAHEIIEKYSVMLPNMELQRNCYDAIEALEYLRANETDLIFLDLNMPKLTGFEFLRTLRDPPKVIVTTAYQEHALEGYELNIVDYLLKPFSFERFLKAVNKVYDSKELNEIKVAPLEVESIFLYADKVHHKVKIEDVLFAESAGNYLSVYTTLTKLMIRETITEFIERFPEHYLTRVHKSYVIAKNHITSIRGNEIRMNEFRIPIGKLYKSNIESILPKK